MKYIITEDRLLELLQSEDSLLALQSAGVDNWGGNDYAFELEDESIQHAEKLTEEMIENNTEGLF